MLYNEVFILFISCQPINHLFAEFMGNVEPESKINLEQLVTRDQSCWPRKDYKNKQFNLKKKKIIYALGENSLILFLKNTELELSLD